MAAAGFEDRVLALSRVLSACPVKVRRAVILDYPNTKLNEPNRTKFISSLSKLAVTVQLIRTRPDWTLGEEPEFPLDGPLIVDITGMNRILIFQVLAELHDKSLWPDIVYTEADQYYPLKADYDALVKDKTPDKAFSRYLREEKKHFAYSYDCRLVRLDRFRGRPEPGKPFMLVAFFAFKRSRLQILLQNLELEKKLFILSEPVRSDLKWRTHCMEIANWDLLIKNVNDIQPLTTLDPFEVERYLESATYDNGDYTRYNIILSPLGSKMQTLGCYLYARRHADVTVLFSQPRQFFPKKFSTGYRETFFVPGTHMSSIEMSQSRATVIA